MSGLHTERVFHDEMLDELERRGWMRGTSANYDRARALYPEDVIAWLTQMEPREYAKVEAMHNGESSEKLLDRLAHVLGQRSTIDVLRNGFEYVHANFSMCVFPPNSGLNPKEVERSKRVILRVVPELKYSESNENRLDLAFFVNGIAVATAELKTENTQTIDDAVRQYCQDRLPKDAITKRVEPLLTWKRGAIVHFAVSTREVRMTTKLDGAKTVFLPFNKGNAGGAGNPPDKGVNYLWEEILDTESWLNILKHFVCIETKKRIVRGKTVRSESVLFPRYHQWDAVRQIVDAVGVEGPGHNYLIQHSAGSGKSNSIMWLAHRLAHLHDAADKKIFDTVFILTDRTVLDDQLANTVQQFDHAAGTIAWINDKGAPKSEQLAKALNERVPIVIVTLQTFPFVMKALEDEPQWKGRSFAVIADEAHSSQTGTAAGRIREILGLRDDEGEVGLDDEVAATIKSDHAKNISRFAFTATPKAKTLEIFGRKGSDDKPEPFHVYTMRQAIEEGFILDVLQNYTTREMAFKVADNDGRDYDVPKGEAAKLITRMARMHSYTIRQKVSIMVEHMRESVLPLLRGRGKAMIVTDSREAAVRYRTQLQEYLDEKGYSDVHALVAFSGEVEVNKDFPGTYTETKMNDLKGMDIPEAFDTDDYNVLVVAEKYQTGFDQPLLCGMYVDKKLENIAAVQTLSRLNRTYNGEFGEKEATYVLDFVNDAQRIEDAFRPYFETAHVEKTTDPNSINDLMHKIDKYGMPGLYDQNDMERFFAEFVDQTNSDKQRQTRLNNLMAPVCDRFLERMRIAKDHSDSQGVEEAEIFRKDLGSFVRLFRFLSQIYPFANDPIGMREVFYDWLARGIREKQTGERADISGVVLTHLKLTKTFEGAIKLKDGNMPLSGIAVGGAKPRPKEFGPLSDVIRLMNEFFGADINDENKITVVANIFKKAVVDEDLRSQALNNTLDKFALGDAKDRIKDWLIESHHDETERGEDNLRQIDQIHALLAEDEKFAEFAKSMISAIYNAIRGEAEPKDS